MLRAMHAGVTLRERVGDWFNYKMTMPDGSPGPAVRTRAMIRLRALAFIERVGDLPPGYPTRVMDYDWKITDAGQAWLAANIDVCHKSKSFVTIPGK